MKIKRLKYPLLTSGEGGGTIECQLIKRYVALYIDADYWILAKGYTLYRYNPKTNDTEIFARLNDSKSALASKFKLIRRALRAEVTHLYHFGEDWYCIARKAIFKLNKATKTFEICRIISRGSRPMNLCQSKTGAIFYGEYFFNPEQKSVNVYKSLDGGKSWRIAYTFKAGEINHIHGIFNDPIDGLWIVTGDTDGGSIIGYTADDFEHLEYKFRGSQKYRVCVPLFKNKDIIYATDSQYKSNTIRVLSQKDESIRDIQPIQGSGIYAADLRNSYAISTTVEPSQVNLDRYSHLWYSSDGYNWQEVCKFKKDIWKTTIFQFGSIRFPHFAVKSDNLVVTGRAVKTIDQNTLIIPISELQK